MTDQARRIFRSPEIIVRTWRAARQSVEGLMHADVRDALERLDPLWDELFPAEQARIVQLLVERVDISIEGADKAIARAFRWRDMLESGEHATIRDIHRRKDQ